MAKKRTYEAEIKVKDSFSKLLDKFSKQLDTVDKKIDKVNKNKINVKAEVDSSFKNVTKQIEKQIPSDKKIKVSATQDISRELSKANRDIFEMNRKLNSNLNSAFKTMASNANKAVQQINSATSGLKTSSIKMPTSAGKLSATNGLYKSGSFSQGSLGGIAGGVVGGMISKGKNKSNASKEIQETEEVAKKSFGKIGNAIDNLKNAKLKPTVDQVRQAKEHLRSLGESFAQTRIGKAASGIKSSVSNIGNSMANGVGSRLPGSMGARYTTEKLSGSSSAMALKVTLKDTASAGIAKIKSKLFALVRPVYNVYMFVKDKVSAVISKITGKIRAITKTVNSVVILARDKASNVIGKIKSKLKPLNKVVKTVISAVDKASHIVKKVLSGIKSLTSKAAKVTITAVDKASGIIKSIGGKIAGLAKAAGAIVIGGAAMSIKEGMSLEKQMVSMQHFMDKLNPGGDTNAYIGGLRDWANNTPFETGEIMGVGARALQISDGDTEKSMKLVKMASDMAAANPGKSVEMAMEALADANLGESARLTEFGIKMSSDELQAGGGLDGLINEGGALDKLYTGASSKLAQTTSGKMSTITGKVKSGMADMGKYILDAVNQTGMLDGIISKLDNIFAGDNAQKFAQNIIDTMGRLKDALAPMLQPIKDMFNNLFGDVDMGSVIDGYISVLSRLSTAAAPIIDAFCGIIENMVPRMQPIIDNVISIFELLSPAFTTVVNMITPVLDFFMSVFEKVSQFIIDNSDTINSIVQTVGEIWEKVWSALSSILEVAWGILEPILSALMDLLGWVLDLINGFLDGIGKVTSWIGDKWDSFTSWLGGGDDGATKSHASGLNYVPYDGYKFTAHQGEMILPRMEADRIRQGKSNGGTTVTFGDITIQSSGNPTYDAKEFIKEVSTMLTEGMFNNNPVY